MLMENGRLSEAQPYYEEADRLYPGEPLILIPLAQIRIESGNEAALPAAISDLTEAVNAGGGSPFAWRLLATAYGRTGDVGMAAVALAEEAMAQGDPQRALGAGRSRRTELGARLIRLAADRGFAPPGRGAPAPRIGLSVLRPASGRSAC